MSVPAPVGELVIRQLTGPWGRVFFAAYYLTMAVLAIWTIDDVRSPWPTIGGLVLFAAASIALCVDTALRLTLPVTLFVAVVGVANALLISWQLERGGHSQWYFGAGTVMMFFVSLRGRIVLAWVGFAAMAAVIAVWGATTPTGIAQAAMIIGRQVPIVLVGTLFAIGMRRTLQTIGQLAEQTSRRATAEAVAEATAHERAARLAALDEVALPLLNRIVEGGPIRPEEQLDFALAEAELRDSLRARALATPAVVEAVRDARRRGIGVTLLDDSAPGSLTPEALGRAAAVTSSAVRAAKDGRVTARLLPAGRENVATVVVDGTDYASHEVPHEG